MKTLFILAILGNIAVAQDFIDKSTVSKDILNTDFVSCSVDIDTDENLLVTNKGGREFSLRVLDYKIKRAKYSNLRGKIELELIGYTHGVLLFTYTGKFANRLIIYYHQGEVAYMVGYSKKMNFPWSRTTLFVCKKLG